MNGVHISGAAPSAAQVAHLPTKMAGLDVEGRPYVAVY